MFVVVACRQAFVAFIEDQKHSSIPDNASYLIVQMIHSKVSLRNKLVQ